MPSTWSAVNRCLFLLRTSPALEKARLDVALDACAHNRRLAKFAISGYLTWYLPHHCNTVVSLNLWLPRLFPPASETTYIPTLHTRPPAFHNCATPLASRLQIAARLISTILLSEAPLLCGVGGVVPNAPTPLVHLQSPLVTLHW